jgi:hypothetical protein
MTPTPLKLPKYNIPKHLIQVVMKNLKRFPNMTQENEHFLNILENIKKTNKLQLKEDNYLQIFELMLYIEEIQNRLNMKRYNQFQTIEKLEHSIKIHIDINKLVQEGLIIKIFDRVKLYDLETKQLFYIKVKTIMNDYIVGICKQG